MAAKLIHAALTALSESKEGLSVSRVRGEVQTRVKLDRWAKEQYEKSGSIRWHSLLYFFSINCVKAGYLVKKKGNWYITEEGERAVHQSPEDLLYDVIEKYRQWKRKRQGDKPAGPSEQPTDDSNVTAVNIDQVEQLAAESITEFISKKNPYEFQDLVAALLRGMGYHTPFVAPRGKDGGVDVLAYRDPFGIESPRIKVQVKHRGQSATVQEVRGLIGILNKDGDVGLFVSTGGFTADAKVAATTAHVHVQLIDIDDFISLWQEFYKKLPDEDKSLMPLTPVYFVLSTE